MAKLAYHAKQKHRSALKGVAAPALIFLFVIVFFIVGTKSLSSGSTKRQRESLENALKRDIVFCYATTGRYPENLQSIKDNYGLIYNEDMFFVDYQVRGSNLMPDITIIQLVDNDNRPLWVRAVTPVMEYRNTLRENFYYKLEENGTLEKLKDLEV